MIVANFEIVGECHWQSRSSPAGIEECHPGVGAEPQEGLPALLGLPGAPIGLPGAPIGLPGAPAPCGPRGRSAHRAFGTWRLCKVKLKPPYPLICIVWRPRDGAEAELMIDYKTKRKTRTTKLSILSNTKHFSLAEFLVRLPSSPDKNHSGEKYLSRLLIQRDCACYSVEMEKLQVDQLQWLTCLPTSPVRNILFLETYLYSINQD